MNYGMQLTFRMQWFDVRLLYSGKKDADKFIYLSTKDSTRVWLPDLFFSNEVSSHFHDVLRPNMYFRIFPDGAVLYSTRLTVKLSCPMLLKWYPHNRQMCSMRMASYAFTRNDTIFNWKELSPVQVTPDLHLPGMSLQQFSTGYCDSGTTTGNYSCIRLDFVFAREFSIHLVETYIPCAMLVLLAWLSLWLEHAGPASVGRLLMGVATLLVMAGSVQQSNSPAVSYTKAIDVYTGICLTFVFSTIVEFIVVNHLSRKTENSSSSDCNNAIEQKGLFKLPINSAARIDFFAKIVYPIGFLLFICTYSIVVLTRSDQKYADMVTYRI